MSTLDAYSLVFNAHGYDEDNPKSLKSITAVKAARLTIEIEHCKYSLAGLPALSLNWLSRKDCVPRYIAMEAKYKRKLAALNMLLCSYADLLEDEHKETPEHT